MKEKILMVCLGNICRSPAAEEILRRMAAEAGQDATIEVDSAGTYGGHAGDLPDPRMRRAAAARGYRLIHRSRPVNGGDFDAFDRIIAMDDSVYERLCRMAPSDEALRKISRMVEYCPSGGRREVPDPYYEGAQGFELVLDMLEEGCRNLLSEIRSRNRS